jgi:hypothetical protein
MCRKLLIISVYRRPSVVLILDFDFFFEKFVGIGGGIPPNIVYRAIPSQPNTPSNPIKS